MLVFHRHWFAQVWVETESKLTFQPSYIGDDVNDVVLNYILKAMSLIRVVSNGYGEDLIASRIIQALGQDQHSFDGYPLVGDGRSYQLAFSQRSRNQCCPVAVFYCDFVIYFEIYDPFVIAVSKTTTGIG